MKRLLLPLVCAVIAAPLFAQTPAPPTAQKKAPAAGAAKKAPVGAAKKGAATTARKLPLTNPALFKAKAPEVFKAKFTTTQGDFVVQVTRAWAPLGADRFYNLVKNGYYDNVYFFRVLKGFMTQFGISSRPEVSKAWSTAKIQDDPVTQSNKRGAISYAMAGPGTRTTQVFINTVDNSRLDGSGFASFGQVIEGIEVVDKLYGEYGEGAPGGAGPDQHRIETEGAAYLTKNFPKLDSVKTAVIVP